ncbi:MAG TPA: hypothetical protein VF115_11685 [Acidimicrobiia bacterium]
MSQKTAAPASKDQLWGKGRRTAFYFAVARSLLAMLITGPVLTLPVTAWLSEATLDAMFGEEGLGIHRVHMQGASLLFWLTIVAMVAQFRHPESKAAPLWAAVAGWVVFLPVELTHLVDPYSILITALVVVALALHPRRWPTSLLRWQSGPRLLAVPFAVVAFGYGYLQAMLQLNAVPGDPHAVVSHYELMTGIAVGLAVSALLGATYFSGHLISAWTASILTLVLAVFYIGHPDQMSSVGVGWGSALVVWGLVYLFVSTRFRRNLATKRES